MVKADYEECPECGKFVDELFTAKTQAETLLDKVLGPKLKRLCKECINHKK